MTSKMLSTEDSLSSKPSASTSTHHQQGSKIHPLSVTFIDNHLLGLHEAFTKPQSKYDPGRGKYMPASMITVSAGEGSSMVASNNHAKYNDRTENNQALSKPAPTAFWDTIFPKSIERLKSLSVTEPKYRTKSGHNYSIRSLSTWSEVYGQLQKAREVYDADTKGLWGCYTMGRRWVIDHSTPVAQQAIKFVPPMDCATPVIAAVQVLIDAFETSSKVRDTMTSGLEKDDLERNFSIIESFLATFPKDQAIQEASVELIAATLKAIEDTISFFLESDLKKAVSATLRGKDYQKRPVASIENIRIRSDQLLKAAHKSHIAGTKQSLDDISEGTAALVIGQKDAEAAVHDMTEKVNSVLIQLNEKQVSDAFLRSTLMELLNDARDAKEKELEERRRLNEYLTENISRLERYIETIGRAAVRPPALASPFHAPQAIPLPPIAPSPTHASIGYPQYTSDAFQIPQLLPPSPHQQLTWYTASPQFQGQWLSPSPPQSVAPSLVASDALLNMFKAWIHVDEVDISGILENKVQSLTFREKRKADLIVCTKQFRGWMVNTKSSELLIHGGVRRSRSVARPVSALSVFCATLTQTFRKGGPQDNIALVFFCGMHMEYDDEHRGARGIIRSFIAQLLRIWQLSDGMLSNGGHHQIHVPVTLLSNGCGSVSQLLLLFGHLLRQLPESVTVICIIDAVCHYETDRLEAGMLRTVDCLLNMARDDTISAAVKVLATSPTMTDAVQSRFRDDGSHFISLAQIRDLGQGLGLRELSSMSEEDESSIDSSSSESEDSHSSGDADDDV